MNLTSPKQIQELLKQHGLSPLKKFGQNFLCDENIVNKIADSVGLSKSDYVFEVGTGLGALTVALSKRAKKVVSVEIDKGLLALHAKTLAGKDNIQIIEQDILNVDVTQLSDEYFSGQAFYVCGNLPYYITSKIIMQFVESGAPIKSMTFMVQKEVAERLCAKPGDTSYSSLTAACNYYAQPKLLFTVSRNCFLPAPDVDSAIIQILFSQKMDVPHSDYSKVVRASFAMRRKTIYNNLKQIAPQKKVQQVLKTLQIDEKSRAQELSPEQFCKIAQQIFQ